MSTSAQLALTVLREASAIYRRRKKQSALKPTRQRVEGKAKAAFEAQRKTVQAYLREFGLFPLEESGRYAKLSEAALSQFQLNELLDLLDILMETQLTGTLQRAIADALIKGANNNVDLIGLFDLQDPDVVRYLQDKAASLVSGINQTTRDRLRSVLADAAANQLTFADTVDVIDATFQSFGSNRASLIAVTELADAFEFATLNAASKLEDAGIQMQKSWLTAGDDRVSQNICMPNGAMGAIRLQDTFWSGHLRPPGHPRCRCTLLVEPVQ